MIAGVLLAFLPGTKNTTLQYGDDGSLTLCAGATYPGADKDANWLPAPGGAFSLYIRGYWPQKEMIDGSWLPPAVILISEPPPS
jgi:hypothetical protein